MRAANFSYVVEGVLAASSRPRTGGAGADEGGECDDLAELVREGFAGVVSLTEGPLPAEAVEGSGLAYLHLPVRDFSAPSLETVRRFVDFVRRISAGRGPVLVHCGSGYGRSGTMAACYLVSEGSSAEEATAKVRRLRPGSVETEEQEEAVRAWEDGEKSASPRRPGRDSDADQTTRHGDTENGARQGW